MLCITATILTSCITAQTPDTWKDPRVDPIDKKAMEQMVSFAPPPIPLDATWVIPDDAEQPTWEDFLGKVVVIQSWSNKQPSGRLVVGAVTKAIKRSKTPNDIVLLTIHTPMGYDSAYSYLEKKGISPLTIIDKKGKLCNSLGIFEDPANIVIDRNGVIRHVCLRTSGLMRAIKELVEEERDPNIEAETFAPPKEPTSKPASYPTYSTNFGKATNMQGKAAPKLEVEKWFSAPLDTENKVRVVEFWATWCPPCRKSIPHLNELAAQFGDSVSVIGLTDEPANKVQPFMKTTSMNYGVATDTQKRMKNTIGCSAIPLSLVIGSDNIIRWQGHPTRLTPSIIQQVLSADSGEGIPEQRGRWDASKNHG
jgi:cytochrome c biogenesis protein CcmG/thiol:disulfide interchange protein DsbE